MLARAQLISFVTAPQRHRNNGGDTNARTHKQTLRNQSYPTHTHIHTPPPSARLLSGLRHLKFNSLAPRRPATAVAFSGAYAIDCHCAGLKGARASRIIVNAPAPPALATITTSSGRTLGPPTPPSQCEAFLLIFLAVSAVLVSRYSRFSVCTNLHIFCHRARCARARVMHQDFGRADADDGGR